MKKILFGAMALISAIAFTSCHKDYRCVCRFNNAVVYSQNYDDVTRAEAEDKCDGDATALGGAAQWDCDVEL